MPTELALSLAAREFAVQKLIQGLHQFESTIFDQRRELFEALAKGQRPEALFITCSDSRVNPNLLTQTDPGDLFILRTAGNIIPPAGAPAVGEPATIEYALEALHVKHIIVCGHTHCGAMQGLLEPEKVSHLPAVKNLLGHAEGVRRTIMQNYAHLEGEARLKATIKENVLAQIENLRTHPSVRSHLARGDLHLHAWVYNIEEGRVLGFDNDTGQFMPLSLQHLGHVPAPTQLHRAAI